jgi:hypothetical protein
MIADVDFHPFGAGELLVEPGVAPNDPVVEPEEAVPGDDGVDLLPSFIYTPTGVYEVPDEYIARDHDDPVHINSRDWRGARKEHRALSAGTFLKGKGRLHAGNIVCIARPEASVASGKPEVIWCIRLAVHGGNVAFKEPFGSSFLWQLPHGMSMSITLKLERFETDNLIGEEHGTHLLKSLRCTYHDFTPDKWPAFKKVSKINNYYDCVFAMACAPSSKPLYPWCEATSSPLRKRSLARPVSFQPTAKCMYFDAAFAPDDAMTYIMETAAKRLVDTPHLQDFKELLNMRLVCKSWNNVVNTAATESYNHVLRLLKRAAKSSCVNDIIEARDVALNGGFSALAIIQDSARPVNVVNYMRVKSGKRPGSMPPSVSQAECKDAVAPHEEENEKRAYSRTICGIRR